MKSSNVSLRIVFSLSLVLLMVFFSCITDADKESGFTLEALSETSSTATINSGVGLELELTNKDDKSYEFSIIISSSLGLYSNSNSNSTFTLNKKTKKKLRVNFDIPNNPDLIGRIEETKVQAVRADGKAITVKFYTEIVTSGGEVKLVQNMVSIVGHERFTGDGWRPGTWSGNTFSGSWDIEQFGHRFTGNVSAEFDPATYVLKRFKWNETKHGYHTLSFELKDMPFDHYYDYSTYNLTFSVKGRQGVNHVVSYQRTSYSSDGTTNTSHDFGGFSDPTELTIWFSWWKDQGVRLE